MCVRERERERETETETERERQTDRQTDRQTETERESVCVLTAFPNNRPISFIYRKPFTFNGLENSQNLEKTNEHTISIPRRWLSKLATGFGMINFSALLEHQQVLLSPSDYGWRERNTGRAVLRGKSPGLGISWRG